MHELKIKTRCWQMNFSVFWHATTGLQPNIFPYLKKGRSRLCAGQRRFDEGHLLLPNPLAPKTERVTNLFWHNYKLFIHCLPTVRWCQSACFSMKSSSACYHKCQSVLTGTAGVCSGKEVNDQQGSHSSYHSPDGCLEPEIVDLVNNESTVTGRGGMAGWRYRGKEVKWCWMITWGLILWSGGQQEADAWVIQTKKILSMYTDWCGFDCCNYVVECLHMNRIVLYTYNYFL